MYVTDYSTIPTVLYYVVLSTTPLEEHDAVRLCYCTMVLQHFTIVVLLLIE